MSTQRRKPYKMRSSFQSFERDVVGATVDVSVAQLRGAAAKQLPAVAGGQLSQLSSAWTPDLCSTLTVFATGLSDITNVPRHVVAWVFTGLAHAMGCPPFLAQIVGRLVANWLLAPLNPVDLAVRRIRILGVLLCAEYGDLDHCPCLVDLSWQLGASELKEALDEGLGLFPESPDASAPISASEPAAKPRVEPGAGGRQAPEQGGIEKSGETVPERPGEATGTGERKAQTAPGQAAPRAVAEPGSAPQPEGVRLSSAGDHGWEPWWPGRRDSGPGETPEAPGPGQQPEPPEPPGPGSPPRPHWPGRPGPPGPGGPGSGPPPRPVWPPESPEGGGAGPPYQPQEPPPPHGTGGVGETYGSNEPTESPGNVTSGESAHSGGSGKPFVSGLAAIQEACVAARGDTAPPVNLRFGAVS